MKNLLTTEWVETIRKNAKYCTNVIWAFDTATSNGWNAFCDVKDVARLQNNPPHSSEDLYFELWKDGVKLKAMWRGGQSYPNVKIWWQVRDIVDGVFASFETRRIYEVETLEQIFELEKAI